MVKSEAGIPETPLMPWSLWLNWLSQLWLKVKPWQLLVWTFNCSVMHLMFVGKVLTLLFVVSSNLMVVYCYLSHCYSIAWDR